MHTKVEAIYAIRHKESGEYVRANGKGCWMSKGAAANSWGADNVTSTRNENGRWVHTKPKFSGQEDYEIVDILSEVQSLRDTLSTACNQNDELFCENQELILDIQALHYNRQQED